MMAMNGTGEHVYSQQEVGEALGGGLTIKVAPIELNWSHIWKLMVLVGGGISMAYAGGWLALPAKQRDLDELKPIVQMLNQNQNEMRTSLDRLAVAMNTLSGAVADLQKKVDEPIIVAPAPSPAVPAPNRGKRSSAGPRPQASLPE